MGAAVGLFHRNRLHGQTFRTNTFQDFDHRFVDSLALGALDLSSGFGFHKPLSLFFSDPQTTSKWPENIR